MDSVDTNILVRYYTGDDPVQSPRAAHLLATRAPLFVPVSVLLETVWVLESRYELARAGLLRVMRHMLELPALNLESHAAIADAVKHYASGLQFEDALHLALSSHCETLWTFDNKGFARKSAKLGLKPACRTPP